MKILICGYGDIGQAYFDLHTKAGREVEVYDPRLEKNPISKYFDVIQICFGFSDHFIADILMICDIYRSEYVLIESTIEMYRLQSLLQSDYADRTFIYSAVRGATHPNITEGLLKRIKFCAPVNSNDFNRVFDFIRPFYLQVGIDPIVIENYNEIVLAKLIETTWYGMNIAFANQIKQICDEHNLDFDLVYTQNMRDSVIGREYFHVQGRAKAPEEIPRPVMTPGKIGGHCVMPNLKLWPYNPKLNNLLYWIQQLAEDK